MKSNISTHLYLSVIFLMLWSLSGCAFFPNASAIRLKSTITYLQQNVKPQYTNTKLTSLVKVPPAYLPRSEYRGYFTESFEVSSFVLCSDGILPGYGKGYWLEASPISGFEEMFSEKITAMASSKNSSNASNLIVYVRFIGQISNPAYEPYSLGESHGHMGLYKQSILVLKTLDMESLSNAQCN